MSTPTPMPAPSAAAKIRRSMASPSVTGKADRVARVVGRVVDRVDRGKTGDADEHDAEQDRGDAIAHRVAPRVGNRDRLDQTGHLVLLRPPPEDMRVADGAGRPPGSRVTASLAFPKPPVAPVARRGMLAAHSCGGSRGFGRKPSPRSLLRPAGAGTATTPDYSGRANGRKLGPDAK